MTSIFSFHEKRIAIPEKDLRNKLKNWIQRKLKQQSVKSFKEMLRVKYSQIYSVLVWCEDNFQTLLPNSVIDILNCLASPSPVCSYIYPDDEVYNLIQDLFLPNVKSDAEKNEKISRQNTALLQYIMRSSN